MLKQHRQIKQKSNRQSHHKLKKTVQLLEFEQHLHKLKGEAPPNARAKCPTKRE